jgi:hypothetical protein
MSEIIGENLPSKLSSFHAWKADVSFGSVSFKNWVVGSGTDESEAVAMLAELLLVTSGTAWF